MSISKHRFLPALVCLCIAMLSGCAGDGTTEADTAPETKETETAAPETETEPVWVSPDGMDTKKE